MADGGPFGHGGGEAVHYDNEGLGGEAWGAGEGEGEAVRADVDEGGVGSGRVVWGRHLGGWRGGKWGGERVMMNGDERVCDL